MEMLRNSTRFITSDPQNAPKYCHKNKVNLPNGVCADLCDFMGVLGRILSRK